MPTADEYRATMETNGTALRAAIEDAADRWEQVPDGDEEWSPRAVAEHAVGSEYWFSGIVASAMQGKPTDRPELSFPTSAEALAALDAAKEAADKAYRYVEDRDLEKPAELNIGAFPNTIEGVLQITAWHRDDHAKQIRSS
jgi:hypothetical protein